MSWQKVHFNDHNLWWDKEQFLREGDTPLAPPEHIDETTQDLDPDTAFTSPTYAHIKRDGIYRYGERIGDVTDIKDGWR